MRTLKLSFLLCTVLLADPLWLRAQSSSCDVPVVVTRFAPASGGSELVTDLAAKDFSITVGGSRATAKMASVDSGGKRIALLLDASRKISDEQWKLELELAQSLLGNGRAADRFSLSLVEAANPDGSFMASEELKGKLRDMAGSRPDATDNSEKTYDSLVDAAKRFDPPAFGDTIFLFGNPDDSGSQASLEQAEESILRNRLRFYALSFTNPLAGKLPNNFDLNKPLPKNAIPGGADDIAHATGYFFSYHQVEVLRRFPDQIRLLQGFLKDEYAGVVQPYKLEISPSPSGKARLDLGILNADARGIRQADVHFQKVVYPCASR